MDIFWVIFGYFLGHFLVIFWLCFEPFPPTFSLPPPPHTHTHFPLFPPFFGSQSTPALLSGVHRLAPHKAPGIRIDQLRLAGELRIPFTTGILLGVGEEEGDRRRSLEDIAVVAREVREGERGGGGR